MGDGLQRDVPFFRQPELTPKDNTFAVCKRMVKSGFGNLFFLGLAQPLPTLVNFAEQQSKLVAAAISARYACPLDAEMAEMAETIVADEKVHLGHFYDSPRHRMQVDFNTYVADLMKEIERGAERLLPVTSACGAWIGCLLPTRPSPVRRRFFGWVVRWCGWCRRAGAG